jgi:transposase-like protein
MSRIVSGIDTLEQHLIALNQTPKIYHPTRCPNCGHGKLRHHGYYYRKADRSSTRGEDNMNPIPIPRYQCLFCQRSCSRLPSYLPPHRWYHWKLQQKVLESILQKVRSYRACNRRFNLDRSTVRRWWHWLESSTPNFEFSLRSRYPELGRTTGGQSFWLTALQERPLSFLMTSLDNDGVSVP